MKYFGHIACYCFLAQVILSHAAHAHANTAKGYVTQVNTPAEFFIGALHVRLSAETQCELLQVKDTTIIPIGDKLPSARHPAKLLYDLDSSHSAYSLCASEPLGIGSRVVVNGQMTSDGMEAQRLVIYKHYYKTSSMVRGGALVEEHLEYNQGRQGENGTIWIDGYPLRVAPQTKVIRLPSSTRFSYGFGGRRLGVGTSAHGPKFAATPSDVLPNSWVAYVAQRTSSDVLIAKSIEVWPNLDSSEVPSFLRQFKPEITPPHFDQHVPGTILFKNATPIQILPDQAVQQWIAKAGEDVLSSIPVVDYGKGRGLQFRFFVVGMVPSLLGDYFIPQTGFMPQTELVLRKIHTRFLFTRRERMMNVSVRSVVASPDGTVMIPATVLASLQNRAQIMALLSYVVAAVIQRQSYRSFPPIMVPSEFERRAVSGSSGLYVLAISRWLNEETLRLGIRQMYLAGYDIREAPFAWAVAQGNPVNNPVIDSKHPDKEIPWYAAYAFNYISKYYRDVDYSKLKRGEREYQAFKDELRRVDPAAFTAAAAPGTAAQAAAMPTKPKK